MAEYVEVVFRMYNHTTKSVIALFPDIIVKENKRTLTKYYLENVNNTNNNGYCNYDIQIRGSKPATPEEYEYLCSELKRVGYNLIIINDPGD